MFLIPLYHFQPMHTHTHIHTDISIQYTGCPQKELNALNEYRIVNLNECMNVQ